MNQVPSKKINQINSLGPEDALAASSEAGYPPIPGVAPALFLDVDGTLAPIAPLPSLAAIPPATLELVGQLADGLDGAVALVSGRSLMDIDAMCAPSRFPAAGQHGLETRGGLPITDPAEDALMAEMERQARDFANEQAGILIEAKGGSLAMHYRQAPHLAGAVRSLGQRLHAQASDLLCLQDGKMVVEVRLKRASKGSAVNAFMESAPFQGRLPVFAGDDVTDEAGFEATNALGGISIKIGEGETTARYRLPDPAALYTYLQSLETTFSFQKGRIAS